MDVTEDQEKTCRKCLALIPSDGQFCGTCGSPVVPRTKAKSSDPLIGTVIGNRFVVIEEIAKGGMGVVYRAEQMGIWRQVALKVLRPKVDRDKKALFERFRNEASTASMLNHPNTITIYDFGLVKNNGLYIAMEFVTGPSLGDELKRMGALDWQRTCHIAIQICGSLQEAHKNNIIHRDLKPDNIMLTKRDIDVDVVKVLDFGIAKIMADERTLNRPSLTANNEIFGTPEYMSPEQIRGDSIDPRADIYSLGIILYRMLTGHLPFTEDAPLALLAKHLMELPLPFSSPESAPEVPIVMETLVMSCLAKDRADRPQNMRIIADRLLKIKEEHERRSLKTDSNIITTNRYRPVSREDTSTGLEKTEMNLTDRETIVRATAETAVIITDDAFEADVGKTIPDIKPALYVSDKEPDDIHIDAEDLFDIHVEEITKETEQDGHSFDETKNEATLNTLLEKMQRNQNFPAMSRNITELNSKASRQDTSAHQLANIIIKDYGLTTKLLKLVNSPLYGQYRGRVMTVSRAVVIMGFEQVRQLAVGLMLFEHLQTKSKRQAKALKDAALGSLTSGLMAKEMAKHIDGIDGEEALVCSMFNNLGKHLSIYYFPKENRDIRHLVQKKGFSENQAALKVMGISHKNFGQALAKQWEFPELIRQSMDHLPSGKVPKPNGKNEQLRDLSSFTNELTEIAGKARPQNLKTTLDKMTNRFENSFTVSKIVVEKALKGTISELQDYSKILNMKLQDSTFVRRAQRFSGAKQAVQSGKPRVSIVSEFPEVDSLEPPFVVNEDPPIDKLEEQKKILSSGTEEVILAMTKSYDLNSLIMMVLETIYRGLDLSRIIFCIHDVKKGAMIARSGFGEDVETLRRQFRFKPRRGRDLFNQAVSRGTDIIVDDARDPRFKDRQPAWFRRIADPKVVLLYPVIVRNFPAGLFYGDMLTSEKKVNRGLLMHMNKLRNQTARAMREKR